MPHVEVTSRLAALDNPRKTENAVSPAFPNPLQETVRRIYITQIRDKQVEFHVDFPIIKRIIKIHPLLTERFWSKYFFAHHGSADSAYRELTDAEGQLANAGCEPAGREEAA